MLKSAFGGLSTGVCRQPQWAYVGVFMYSLARWRCEDEIGLGTWVELCHRRREKYNSRGYRFLMFTGISAGNLSLCPRGVYVFIGWVELVLQSELFLIIHAEMPLRLFMDFSAGSLCISNRNTTCISRETVSYTSRGTIPPHNSELPSRVYTTPD